jgi:hypothetical protein
MLNNLRLFLWVSFIGLVITSCDKDDDNPPDNEQELITTVKLTLRNPAIVSEVVTATWRDIDGPGGAAPVIQDLVLKPNTVYEGKVEFLDESTPADVDNITEEVEEEDTDHQVYYIATGAALTITDYNTDANNLPLGTEAIFTTVAASTGSLKVLLKHKPGNKAANDPSTKGETDVDVDFPVRIQ